MAIINKIIYGQRLREARKEANLTRIALAKMIGASPGSIKNWESGKTSPNEIYQSAINEKSPLNPDYLYNGNLPIVKNSHKINTLQRDIATIKNKSHALGVINVWANAGMGGGYFNPDEQNEPIEQIEIAHLLNYRYRDSFRAHGFSMLPVIRPNALCFCDFKDGD